MAISNAIELIAIAGRRSPDGLVEIDGTTVEGFPRQITVEGATFDLAEEEEIDVQTKDCLAHYFRRNRPAAS